MRKKAFMRKLTALSVTAAAALAPVSAYAGTPGVTSRVVSQGINSSNQYVWDGNQTDSTLSNRLIPRGDGPWGLIVNGKVDTSKNGLFGDYNG